MSSEDGTMPNDFDRCWTCPGGVRLVDNVCPHADLHSYINKLREVESHAARSIKPAPEPRCETCIYFEMDRCKARCPVLTEDGFSSWPHVSANDICGEYERRESESVRWLRRALGPKS